MAIESVHIVQAYVQGHGKGLKANSRWAARPPTRRGARQNAPHRSAWVSSLSAPRPTPRWGL